MKILVLSRNANLYSTSALVKAAEERGHEVRSLLTRNGVPHAFHTRSSPYAMEVAAELGDAARDAGVIVTLPALGHDPLVDPTNQELAAAYGARTALGDERSEALWNELRPRVADHLEAVRLIGEDIELRPPRYVPLEIHVVVCADDAYWREDLRFVLEQEFSDAWTSDGRRGFFHPDEWTFGQHLHRSAIEGRLHRVPGIEHVVSIRMKRFDAPTPGAPDAEVLEMGFDEVVLLANDPDHLERGFIRFEISGGRV